MALTFSAISKHTRRRSRYLRALRQLEILEPRTLMSVTSGVYTVPGVQTNAGQAVYDSFGNLWALNNNDGTLDEIDSVNGSVVTAIPLDSASPGTVLVAGRGASAGHIFASDALIGGIDDIDVNPADGTPSVMPYAISPDPEQVPSSMSMTADGTAIWFVGQPDGPNWIGRWAIQPSSVKYMQIPDNTNGTVAYSIAAAGDNNAWVGMSADAPDPNNVSFRIESKQLAYVAFTGSDLTASSPIAFNVNSGHPADDSIADNNNYPSNLIPDGSGGIWLSLSATRTINPNHPQTQAVDTLVHVFFDSNNVLQQQGFEIDDHSTGVSGSPSVGQPAFVSNLALDNAGRLWFSEKEGSNFGYLDTTVSSSAVSPFTYFPYAPLQDPSNPTPLLHDTDEQIDPIEMHFLQDVAINPAGSELTFINTVNPFLGEDTQFLKVSIVSDGGGGTNTASPTALTLGAANGVYGGTTSLTAMLSSNSSPVAGETVTFLDSNNTVLGTVTTDSFGIATLTGVSLAGINAGTYANAFSASFAGDSSFTASSASDSLTVAADGTSTSLASSVNGPVHYGQSVMITATLTPQAPGTVTPDGQVQFYLNGVPLNGPQTLDATGHVSIVVTGLNIGANQITASYLGDLNFQASAANAPLTQESIADIVLLDSSAKGALTVSGNGQVDVSGSVAVDSSSSSAVSLSGSGVLDASQLDLSGGASVTGHAQIDGLQLSGLAAQQDPLAFLNAPTTVGLIVRSTKSLSISGNQTITLDPGVYIGGVTISGNAHVTLNPGIYYMQGGGFSVSGNGSVTDLGRGVLIYNGSVAGTDAFQFSGNARVSLSALSTGPFAGIVLFQNRASTAAISASGNAALNIGGAIYAADAALNLSGNAILNESDASADLLGATLIVDKLSVTGNAQLLMG